MNPGIRQELLALRNSDGMLPPRVAVQWARENPRSELHAEFEWDDKVAGELFRIDQARRLIAIHVVDSGGHREMVSLSIDRSEKSGYRMMSDVIAKEDLREILLADALAELKRVEQKYAYLTELVQVWAAAQEVEARQSKRRRKRAA